MDFLNSTAMPAGERIEWLANGADLVNWLLQAGDIDAKIAKRFRSENMRALDDVAADARVLREWLRNFAKQHAGKPFRQKTSSRNSKCIDSPFKA